MGSPLSFNATESLRKKLIGRNLVPYRKPGSFTPPGGKQNYEIILDDYSVIDSPDVLIDDDVFVDGLSKLNEFGPNTDYNRNPNYSTLLPREPNKGEYGFYPQYLDAIENYSKTFQKATVVKNRYAPSNGYDLTYNITENILAKGTLQPYWEPPSFRPSSYSPYDVILQKVPTGSAGSSTLDSVSAQLSLQYLKKNLEYRVQQNVRNETIGRVALIDALRDPFNVSLLLAGKRPIIYRDWTITNNRGVVGNAVDILQKIAGTYFPVSLIPGDYFDEDVEQQNVGGVKQVIKAFKDGFSGALFGSRGSRGRTPSELFLRYTGNAQKQQLQQNLELNRYRPSYTYSTGVVGVINNIFNREDSAGNFYVGDKDRDPSTFTSPPGDLPISPTGRELNSPVYGPEFLAKDFENNIEFNNGLNGKSYEDGGGVAGGFVWTSPKYKNNAGKYASPGGDYGGSNPTFNQFSNNYTPNESTNYDLKPYSILDTTQRLIDSQPNGQKRFSHVGNAIDQVSKVFNDGYKEITKGSKVISFVDQGGIEKGQEYCRIFTKDEPYFTFANLQKRTGNIRKFAYSNLDSTYNLNIVPTESNVDKGAAEKNVKKYMLSIENLAWRTSSRFGYRVSDLPVCERGPNGGRIMWFPPYDLKYSETAKPSFNEENFLGRPEPVYTYKSTTRTGSLSFKIVVDHPSILNLVVKKKLANESDRQKVDAIINSFFAGCKEYDLYDLAIKYNTIPPDQLTWIQEIITNPNVTPEQFNEVLQTVNYQPGTISNTPGNTTDFNNYVNVAFYFDNDQPDPKTIETASRSSYDVYYNDYVSQSNIDIYKTKCAVGQSVAVTNFFNKVVIDNFAAVTKLINDLRVAFESNKVKTVTIHLTASASAPQTVDYNKILSSRRIDSIEKYLSSALPKLFDEGKIKVVSTGVGEQTTVNPKSFTGNETFGSFNCTDADTVKTGNNQSETWYSVKAMACRAGIINKITFEEPTETPAPIDTDPGEVIPNPTNKTQPKKPLAQPGRRLETGVKEGITKEIINRLMSECDYFEVLKETDPFVFDSIKEKIKYFNPVFHSMTPEGLNSRLTFLQQCTRPGDTIPTVGLDGKTVTNAARNTAFGVPPVLVLRVGDFWNSKIIPTNIDFKYESGGWDLNPEGIGLQPMIVDVTLTFNFVGGQGLKVPVDKLQNALSFNYYANTEMYDPRSDATEDTSVLDKRVVTSILGNDPTGVKNITSPPAKLGTTTIGEVLTSTTPSGTTSATTNVVGTISYAKIMDSLLTQSKEYTNSIVNFNEGIINNYNYGILQLLTTNLKYVNGKIDIYNTPLDTKIFGIPGDYQTYIDNLFNKFIDDLDNESSGFFTYVAKNLPNATKTDKTTFKNNYKNFLKTHKGNFLDQIAKTINDIQTKQQSLVYTIDSLNYVLTDNDGYIKNGEPKLYRLTHDIAMFNQMTADLTKVKEYYNDFITSLETSDVLLYDYDGSSNNGFITKTTIGNVVDQREFMIIANEIVNKSDSFISTLTINTSPNFKNIIYVYYDSLVKPAYITEIDEEKKVVQNYRTNQNNSKYLEFDAYPSGVVRTTDFTDDGVTFTNDDKTRARELFDNNNFGEKDQFNLKKIFN
jgi:hypothetical protein